MLNYGLFGKIGYDKALKSNTKKSNQLIAPTDRPIPEPPKGPIDRPLPQPEETREWSSIMDMVEWSKNAGIEERKRKEIEAKAHQPEIIEPEVAPNFKFGQI